ncbi:P-loop containing nucleoside triphosphate hydrolase protein [Lanmaoa asiatica]|nr:P-loop containing nucleoside triphosphate hydrolase protein [Lanmaoa asiatica]
MALYLEVQGNGATIRPIVWIILLFLTPIMYSVSYQRSIFIETRVAVHMEALVSDLVFKHTLRIRLWSNDASPDGNNSSSQANLIGTINNHVTTDLANVTEAKDFLPTGAAVMLVLFPVPGYIGSLFQSVEVEKMRKTDGRVQLVSEAMNALRMIKLFGWERKISSKIQDQRVEELVWTRKRSLLQVLNNMIKSCAPFTLLLRTDREQGRSHSIASIPSYHMYVLTSLVNSPVADASKTDTVSEPSRTERSTPHAGGDHDVASDTIGISHATFSWAKSEPGTRTPRNKHFTLGVHDELVFQPKELNLVTGPTGSGKTSLLMALLGEMHFHPSGPSSWRNLPRHLGVAYAAQESWILNRTIRSGICYSGLHNVLLKSRTVLFQCALEPDLALLEHGDLTEVGERGVTLRITLARVIYSSAEILLLDDVFAALDVHTSQWIVNHCFRGKLVKGRTIIMATHNVSLVNDIARYVVTLDNKGQVQSHGPLKGGDGEDTNVTATDQGRDLGVDDPPSDSASTLGNTVPSAEGKGGGTLTTAEEIAEGHIGWSAVLLYLLSWGGRAPVLNWGLFVFGISATHITKAVQSWYLGYWAEQYQESTVVSVGYNITIYSLIMWSTVVLYSLSYMARLLGSLRASKTIHDRLVEKIFGATFRWLDTTPVARVVTRFTQDIGAVDGTFPMSLFNLVELTITMLVKFAAVVYLAPPFALPGLIVAIVGGWCGQVYMKAELSVKRELSNAKAPMLAHLDAALAGLVSIRAFGAQNLFIKEYHSCIDHYTRVARTFYALNCWVSVRLEALGASFAASLAAYLMYGHHNINPSNVGFSLNIAVSFSAFILYWIITYNDTEINGRSLERIASYMDIEQEVEPTSKASPPAYWPASGDLRVENLSARYSSVCKPAFFSPGNHGLIPPVQDGPNVLHNLTFHIHAGERIGIAILPTYSDSSCKQTSLTLSLLRCLSTEGEVYYDGILTSSIDLEVLRSSLTIIPQSVRFCFYFFSSQTHPCHEHPPNQAELLNGTIRQNLDPFDQFEDAILHDALRSAGLSELQESSHDNSNNNRLTLDTPVTAGGTNLSVGQRQILALARAMVRESKLLILDEDHKTDAVIQRSLREMKGVTQLIIAHRLQSVMDTDRIVRTVELDTPSQLLQRDGGIFRTLVYASKNKEGLLAVVKHSA